MVNKMTDEEIYAEAQKRVRAKSKFFKDLIAYIVINTGLFFIWYFVSGRGYPWYLWVLGIWGMFLLIDFFTTFFWEGRMGKSAVEKEAARIRKEQG
jgi:cellulose synthase/poly-beta-1,6-N-acetylglucosamine synthase-like glycosyltransferase